MIHSEDEIRLKIVGTRVDASGIVSIIRFFFMFKFVMSILNFVFLLQFAIGTLMDDFLGNATLLLIFYIYMLYFVFHVHHLIVFNMFSGLVCS